MWIILVVTLLTLWFLYIKWKYSYWSRNGVPNPSPYLIVGNIGPTLIFQKSIGELITNWYNEYKDVPYLGIYRGVEPAIILRDPDLIKDVLIKDFPSFNANDLDISEKTDPLLANFAIAVTGDKWKRSRSMLTPLFTASKIKSIYSNMEFACNNLVDYLRKQPNGLDIETKSFCAKFTTENVIKCAFSLNAKCFEDEPSEFREVGQAIFQPSMLLLLKYILQQLVPKWMSNFISVSAVSQRADNWFRNLVKENSESRKNIATDQGDFMQMLLSIGKKMDATEEELAGQTLNLFLDSFETSSVLLSFVFFELARHPAIQQKLYEEIITVFGKHGNAYSYESVQELSYLDCVVQETLRLDAVSMVLVKICTHEYTLPQFGNQKEGVTVYPGTAVYIPIHGIHRDANYYSKPKAFRPERFDFEHRKDRHSAHFLGFSEGPRICAGIRFAMAQIKAATIAVIREFNITVSPNHKPFEVDPTSIMYQSKHGLLLNFKRRSSV